MKINETKNERLLRVMSDEPRKKTRFILKFPKIFGKVQYWATTKSKLSEDDFTKDLIFTIRDFIGRKEDNNMIEVIRLLHENSLLSEICKLKEGFNLNISEHDPTGFIIQKWEVKVKLKEVHLEESFDDNNFDIKITLEKLNN